MVVIHSTHMPFKASLQRLCDPASKVSCHYLVNTTGATYQLVDPLQRAWHAGISYWRGRESLNDCSIGIELVDTTPSLVRIRKFPSAQMKALLGLLSRLVNEYQIPAFNVVAHSDVAPDRKDDPGEHFDWQMLFESGFGLYHHVKTHRRANRPMLSGDLIAHRQVVVIQKLFRAIGYKIRLTGKLDQQTWEVITAFRRRFYSRAVEDKHFGLVDYEILQEMSNIYRQARSRVVVEASA